MAKKLIPSKGLGGIDCRHTRAFGKASSGKNFYTRGGDLSTRDGSSAVDCTSFDAVMQSLHSVTKVGGTAQLLVQKGRKLYSKAAGVYSELGTDIIPADKVLSSCRWIDKLILAGGSKSWAYNIADNTIAELLPGTNGVVPEMEHIVNWKNRVFGWAPNGPKASNLYFCGYDEVDTNIISINHWPPDFFLDISGEYGLPIITAIPFQTHLLVLTQLGYWRVWGNTEADFSRQYGGATSVYQADSCALVGDTAIWLGVEDGNNVVYAYTGTSPIVISQPIDELIRDRSLTGVKACAVYNQFWLIFPDSPDGHTTVYVYDMTERDWYIYEFPFVITSVVMHGEYNQRKYLHVTTSEVAGLTRNYILRIDDSVLDAMDTPEGGGLGITTEFIYGSFGLDDVAFKARTLWVNAQPVNNFTINFYARMDTLPEYGPVPVTFTAVVNPSGNYDVISQDVKLGRLKGRNCAIRGVSENHISSLQKIDFVVSPKSIK